MMRLVGIDPGFARLGWASLHVSDDRVQVAGMGVFETEKSARKLEVLASNDNFRRARELAGYVRVVTLSADVICAEAMSFPRQASVAAKVAMTWGVLAAECERAMLPLVQASPQAIKKAVCGCKSASKEDVQAALIERFSASDFSALTADLRKGDLEHAFDALGAIVACLDSEVVRMARRAKREAQANPLEQEVA